ncbi:glycoside hydrolase family 88 protein [Paenibacillus sp. LHD-117]|uniref:glycoside hydrolase family 88 protein n=1 Tax=Paenibacillus sp. LHD-117 TaxID=3071412 RepID=UPI0027DEC4DB|nr:glycoside hydrolase family 88 protein [Paenibacillus sp. LHD-117]MDQ6421415.1 glycoside hydrolase family 88 protein [Paenibacillus sp. LHD-117]
MLNLLKDNQNWVENVIAKLTAKMDAVSERSKTKIPYTTKNGKHDNQIETDINWWTNGFWGGMMWLMYHETGAPNYKEIANFTEDALDLCFHQFYGLHHDVGFMWLPTSVANYKVTGNSESRKRAMHAANLLAGRFNLAGGFIRAWNDDTASEDTRGWAIVDCMMNLPLLYWASEETKDPRYAQIAIKHADTALEAFIRPDGSVNHIVEFDPFHGGVVRTYGGQGYEEGSSWTRGQTWALYGFMMSYMHTGKQKYLQAAKRVAHYFMANIPDNGVIPIDFRQPKDPAYEDSTAAAIAACGLIEIAKAVGEYEKDVYVNAALKLLKTLDASYCDWTTDSDHLLMKGSAAYHHQDIHISIIYGDYYFMEAIFKLKGNDLFLW